MVLFLFTHSPAKVVAGCRLSEDDPKALEVKSEEVNFQLKFLSGY